MTSLPLHPVPSALTNLDPARLQKANHLQRQFGCCCPQILLDSKLQHQEEPSKSSEARELSACRACSVVHCRPLETPTPIRGEGSRPAHRFRGSWRHFNKPRPDSEASDSSGLIDGLSVEFPTARTPGPSSSCEPADSPDSMLPPIGSGPPPARWPRSLGPTPSAFARTNSPRRQRGETDSGIRQS